MSNLPILPDTGSRISVNDVLQWERDAATAVLIIDDINVLEEWRAQAAALERYLRSKDLRLPMAGAQRRIEARIGQLEQLAYRGKHGINDKLVAEFRVLARALDKEIELDESEWRTSRRQLVLKLRSRLNLTNGDAPAETCAIDDLSSLAGNEFRAGCIYADPPWHYGNQATRASTGNHYSGMTVDEICDLPIAQLAAETAHLHLWTTNGFLFDAKRVIDAWGFIYKSCFVWVKPQMGIGNYWRVSHEFLLLGTRGRATFANDLAFKSWGEFRRGRHSAKPEQIRKMIERASPTPRLELFGRAPAEGWVVWGNEVDRNLFYQNMGE